MGILIVIQSIVFGLFGALIGLGVGGLFALVLNLILPKQNGWEFVALRVLCVFVVFAPISAFAGFLIGFCFGWTTADFAH